MNKTLALCIPAYNAARYLPRLLKSAINQIIPFDEILVYDDASSDNTKEVAESYGAKVLRDKENKGCSFGKNQLMHITTCDYIHFHDADDELYQNFTTLAHKWMNRVDCPDVVLFDYDYKENNTNEFISIRKFSDTELHQDPIRYSILNQINPFCGLYNKESLLRVGGYDVRQEILYNEDVAFHCKLAINGLTFRSEEEVSLVNYKISDSMSSSNKLKCFQAQFEVMKINAVSVGHKYRKEIASRFWNISIMCASQGDFKTSKRSALMAYKFSSNVADHEMPLIKILSRIHPFFPIITREYLIRIFKPSLRG